MRNFSLKTIVGYIEYAKTEFDTGDEWLETRYLEDVPIIGHTNAYYKWFYTIAERYKPKLTVELGSWRATAAAHFASANPKGEVITIDIHKDDLVAKDKSIEAAGQYSNLTYINKWTWDAFEDVADAVVKLGTGIDILFIDSWHEYAYFKKDWDLYRQLLSATGLVIIDDIFDSEGTTLNMIAAWEEIKAEKILVQDDNLHGFIPMGVVKYVH